MVKRNIQGAMSVIFRVLLLENLGVDTRRGIVLPTRISASRDLMRLKNVLCSLNSPLAIRRYTKLV
jgi:hypothetical protein